MERGRRKLLGVMYKVVSLIVVMVSGVCTYANIKYQIVWLIYVRFLIYPLCFNKAVKIVLNVDTLQLVIKMSFCNYLLWYNIYIIFHINLK